MIVVVCAAFGLTVSEAKTKIVCLRTKGVLESTAMFSVEVAGQVYNQTDKFVYLGGDVNRNAALSIEVDRRIGNACCSFRKYTLKLYNRPSAPPRVLSPDAKTQGTRVDTVRLRHVEPVRVPLRYAAPRPPQLTDLLRWLAKEQSHRPPDFISRHACKDGK